MSYCFELTAHAASDVQRLYDWLAERNPTRAALWYESLLGGRRAVEG